MKSFEKRHDYLHYLEFGSTVLCRSIPDNTSYDGMSRRPLKYIFKFSFLWRLRDIQTFEFQDGLYESYSLWTLMSKKEFEHEYWNTYYHLLKIPSFLWTSGEKGDDQPMKSTTACISMSGCFSTPNTDRINESISLHYFQLSVWWTLLRAYFFSGL